MPSMTSALFDNHDLSHAIIKTTSSLLPALTASGHLMLELTNKWIVWILENPSISIQMKKDTILSLVLFLIKGDNFGGFIIDLYYQILKICL